MTGELVVDANLVVAALGMGPDRQVCHDLFAKWAADRRRLCSPTLCLYEVTSTISKLVRFGEMKLQEGKRALALFESLSIQVMAPNLDQARLAFDWTVRLQRAAAYDSFYLVLAQELGCELWTADRRLCEAANVPWVRSPFE
jgi:predicted nucleic acid-binding protein